MTVVPTMIAKGIECLQRAQTETTINAKELIDRSRQHLLAADHYLRDDTTNHALRCDVLLRLADLEFSVGNLTRAMDFCRSAVDIAYDPLDRVTARCMYLYALFWSGERQVAISLVTILTRDERLDPAAMGVVAYHHACMLYYCGLHWEADEVMYRNRDNVMHENSTSVSYFSLMIDNQRFMGAPWNAVMAMEYKFVAVQLNCHGYDALLATAKEIPHILEDLVKKYPGVTQFHDDICDNTMPALTRLIIRLVKCGLPYDVILPVMEKDEEMCVLLHQDWYVLQSLKSQCDLLIRNGLEFKQCFRRMLDLVKDVCDRPTCRVLRDLIAWVTELKHVSAPTEFMLRISSMCTKISDAPTLITRLSRLVALDCCYSSRFIITPRKTAVIETPPPAAVPLDKFVVSMVKVSSVVGRKSGDVEHAIAGMRKKAPSPEAEELGTLILTEPVDYEASIEGYIVLVDRATPEARRHVLSRMMHLLSVHAKYLLKEGRLVREMLRVLAKWVDYFEHDMITDGFRFCLFIDDTAPEELRSFVFMLLCAGSKKGVINNGDDVVGRMLDAVREGSVDELRSSVFRACLHFLRGSDESDYVSAINLASICCSEFGIDEGLARDMATAILSCGSTAADYGICFLWREHPNVVGDVIRAKSTNKALHYFIEGKVDLAWDAWADHVDADLLRVFVLEGFSKNDEKKNKYMYHLRAMVADHGKYGSMTRIRATQLHLVLSHIGCNEAASWADQLKSCSVRDSILEEALSVKLKREFKVQQQ